MIFLIIGCKEIKEKSTSYKAENISILDERGKSFKLKEIVGEYGEVIIFRFTYLNCDICYKSAVEIVEEIKSKDNIHHNVLIITSLRDCREFKIFTSQLKLKSCKYYFTKEYLCKPLEDKLSFPYFCQLNADLEMHDLYIPKNYDYSGINNYFEKIK